MVPSLRNLNYSIADFKSSVMGWSLVFRLWFLSPYCIVHHPGIISAFDNVRDYQLIRYKTRLDWWKPRVDFVQTVIRTTCS